MFTFTFLFEAVKLVALCFVVPSYSNYLGKGHFQIKPLLWSVGEHVVTWVKEVRSKEAKSAPAATAPVEQNN